MDVQFIFSSQSGDPVSFVVFRIFYQSDRNAVKRPFGEPAADQVGTVPNNYHKSRNSGFPDTRS